MTLPGPLRFRLVGTEVIENGGQVLARLNEDCIPSILDEFVLFLNSVAEAGATDEIEATLFPDSDEKLTKYKEIRALLGECAIAGLVPLPVTLQTVRELMTVDPDNEDTPVILDESFDNDDDNDDETER